MRIDVEILQDNRLVPTVMNINQGQNKIDTALYSMKNYVVNEVDLSTCDWYAVLMGVYGLDEVKLTHKVEEGVLNVTWDLNNYVTNIGQTLTYQIVAKNSDAAVYYTNKGIILNSQSIHADEFIVSNYPSILRQWEDYIKELGTSANLSAYVVMNLGEYIPVNERVEGKFYINRLTEYDYSCLIEDSDGNLITPSARGVSYDPTKTGILANNVQDALDNLLGRIDGNARFTVNSGNHIDGVEDILGYEDNTLSFKVGGEYPNLVATKSDGTTFTRSELPDEDLTSHEDGSYTVYCNETQTEILNSVLYEQETQPSNPQTNDIWRNTTTNEVRKFESNALQLTSVANNSTSGLQDIAYGNGVYVIVGNSGNILTSTDKNNWYKVSGINTDYTFAGIDFKDGTFIVVGGYGLLGNSPDGQNWSFTFSFNNGHVQAITHNDQRYVAVGNEGKVYHSTNGASWNTIQTPLTSTLVNVCYANNMFVAVGNEGSIVTSPDGITWTVRTQSGVSDNFNSVFHDGTRFVITGEGKTVLMSVDGENWTVINSNMPLYSFCSGYHNGYYLVGVQNGYYYISTDLLNFEMLEFKTATPLQMKHGLVVGYTQTLVNVEGGSTWTIFDKVPLGTVEKSGGVITSVYTWQYDRTVIATPSTFGLMRVAAPEDEVDCSCNDASITPSNLYTLSNYRRANTEYRVDDKVGCPYHHNLQLKCIVAGTTSSEALDTKGTLEAGTEIVDGSVTWSVEELGGNNIQKVSVLPVEPIEGVLYCIPEV